MTRSRPGKRQRKAASEEGDGLGPHVWTPSAAVDAHGRTVCADCHELWEHPDHKPSHRRG